jgi:hypothetical protein
MIRWITVLLIVGLPALDLVWNLTHLNIGSVEFYGVTLPALGLVQHGAWPATPYFPAGYPLLLIPFGLTGSTLIGGYILAAFGGILALAGARRLAFELGVSAEWSLAAVALAWAAPTFRITAGMPTPDMLYTGLGVWFLWSAVAVWKRASPAPIWVLTLTACALLLLKYQGYVLVVPVLAALILAGRLGNPLAFKRRPFDPAPARYAQLIIGALVLAYLLNYVPFAIRNGAWMSGASGLQVRTGLEMDAPIFFRDIETFHTRYGAFADFARKRSIIGDYGLTTIVRHTAKQFWRFVRRPPVMLTVLLLGAALALRRLRPGEMLLALVIVGYSLVLALAYYTPQSALLQVIAGMALCLALAARVMPRRSDLALAAVCVLLLAAYWPAGRFARANIAERLHFAELSQQTADLIRAENASPQENLSFDMRIIWPPGLGNPWQKPYPHKSGSWLNDPAIRHDQLPGYFAKPTSDSASSAPRVDK